MGAGATNRLLGTLVPTIVVFHGTEMTFERALASFRTRPGRRRPSLVDCLAFETVRELRIDTAFAFDDHFATAGFMVVPKS